MSVGLEPAGMPISEVADLLGVDVDRVREMADARAIPHHVSGPFLLFDRAEVLDWWASTAVLASSP